MRLHEECSELEKTPYVLKPFVSQLDVSKQSPLSQQNLDAIEMLLGAKSASACTLVCAHKCGRDQVRFLSDPASPYLLQRQLRAGNIFGRI